jgi:hypothetical protein
LRGTSTSFDLCALIDNITYVVDDTAVFYTATVINPKNFPLTNLNCNITISGGAGPVNMMMTPTYNATTKRLTCKLPKESVKDKMVTVTFEAKPGSCGIISNTGQFYSY